MNEIFNAIIYTFGSASALKLIVRYEKKRNGADMQYRFYYRIFISNRSGVANPSGSYANNLRLTFTLNSSDVLTRNVQSSSKGWDFEYTSSWFTVKNKTSGTTPFKFTVKDTQNSGWCNYTSKGFNLSIDPAGSDFGTIANFNIGTAFTVSITKYSEMYDVLTIKLDDTVIRVIDNALNSNLIDFTDEELDKIYGLMISDQNKDFTFELETYEDNSKSTLVGVKKTKVAKGYIIASNPVINSKSAIDVNSKTIDLTGSSSKIVKYESDVKINIKASGVNKATIKSITVNGEITNSGEITLNDVTTNVFNIEVADSRGFITTDSINLEMIDYIPLTVNVDAKRNEPTDGKVILKYSGNYFNDTFGAKSNTLKASYRFREQGGSYGDWISLTPKISNNTYSQEIIIDGFDYKKIYEIDLQVEDALNIKSVIEIPIPKGEPIYWWDEESFNCLVNLIAEKDLTIKGDLTVLGKINSQ